MGLELRRAARISAGRPRNFPRFESERRVGQATYADVIDSRWAVIEGSFRCLSAYLESGSCL